MTVSTLYFPLREHNAYGNFNSGKTVLENLHCTEKKTAIIATIRESYQQLRVPCAASAYIKHTYLDWMRITFYIIMVISNGEKAQQCKPYVSILYRTTEYRCFRIQAFLLHFCLLFCFYFPNYFLHADTHADAHVEWGLHTMSGLYYSICEPNARFIFEFKKYQNSHLFCFIQIGTRNFLNEKKKTPRNCVERLN